MGAPAGAPEDVVRPAVWHALAYAAVQICWAVQKLSATTVSLMLDLVTATGVKRTEGTSVLPLFIVRLCVMLDGTVVLLSRSKASWAAASASGLMAL